MRHQTENIARTIADAGDVIARAVWIGGFRDVPVLVAVTKHDAIFPLEFCERLIVADVVAFSMSNRNSQHRLRTTFRL